MTITAILTAGSPPTHAAPGQAGTSRIYLPVVHQAPPGTLSPAGAAWGQGQAVAADGDLVLVGEGSQVATYRRGDDGALLALGRSEPIQGIVQDILWEGGEVAFVVTRANGARLSPRYAPSYGPLSVSVLGGDWRAPRVLARGVATGFADIQVHRRHAFVCVGQGFTVYDLTDPVAWKAVTSVALPGGPRADGNFVCRHDGEHTLGIMSNRQAQLLRYDVAEPARPSLVASDEMTIGSVLRFSMGDFGIAAGQVHAIWKAIPIAGVPSYTYVPSGVTPGMGVPQYDFGAERPLPPIVRGGLAYFGTAAYSGVQGSLTVVDPQGAAELSRLGHLAVGFGVEGIAIAGNHAWLAGLSQVQAVDIRDPAAPRAAARLSRPGRLREIAAAGGRVFLASLDQPGIAVFGGAGSGAAEAVAPGIPVHALAVAPGTPLVVAEVPAYPREGVDLAVYSADAELRPLGRLALDGADPGGPGVHVYGGGVQAVRVGAGRAYVARESTLADPSRNRVLVLDVVDLSDASRPVRLSQVVLDRREPDAFGGLAEHGERLFVALGGLGEVVELDLGDPAAPVEAARHAIDGGAAGGLAVSGDHLLIAAGDAGLRVVDLAGGWRPLGGLGDIGYAMDVVVDRGMAYAATGDGHLIAAELGHDGSIALTERLALPAGGHKLIVDGKRLWVDMRSAGAGLFEIHRR